MKKIFLQTVLVLIFGFGCADQIVTECETDPLNPTTQKTLTSFSKIQTEVFNVSCALSGCHGDNATQANLLLTEGNAYQNLVGVTSLLYPQFKIVEPGNSANSLLIKVLKGDGVTQMPLGGSLDSSVIDSIALWIDKGALNN